jgi:hypothetical protein
MNEANHKTIVSTNAKKDSVLVVKAKSVSFAELWGNYPQRKFEHIDPKTPAQRCHRQSLHGLCK